MRNLLVISIYQFLSALSVFISNLSARDFY